MKNIARFFSSLGVVGFLASIPLSLPAGAQGGACSQDVDKYCAGLPPGDGRLIQCLMQHDAELSAGCKQAGDELKQKMSDYKQACSADAQKFCANVTVGKGARIKCLKVHQSELSSDCQSALATMKGRHSAGTSPNAGTPAGQ